jgi:hydrogenase maturation protease
MKKDVLILGVGNLLLGDEGVGVHVAQQLLQMPLPANVEVVDGGTIGFELLPYAEGKKKIVIVDAIHADAEPGTLFRFNAQDAELEWSLTYSPHQSGLRELLDAMKSLPSAPEVFVFGIVPAETHRLTIGLSRTVHRRVPGILEEILEEVHAAERQI